MKYMKYFSQTYKRVDLFKITVVLSVLSLPSIATARSALDSPYPLERLWSSTVRFLRVDQRFPILEKDKDAGYILFDFVEEATKVHKASLELVEIVDAAGRSTTRVVLSIPDKPRHVEALLLEKLQRKAKDDLGAPPPPKPKRDSEKSPDAKRRDEADKPTTGRTKEPEQDPNQPERGEDGLPRLPHHKDFPRPSE